jgi:hypothetical protein
MFYEIKYEPVIIDGNTINKYNIYYFGGKYDGLKEFYAYDLLYPQTDIRFGYTERK